MDIEMPSGHPVAAAVQPVWPHTDSSEGEHNADVARKAVQWAQQGIDALDRAQNLHRDGWKGQSGEAAQQENTAIKHAAQKFQAWQYECAQKFQESAGETRAFKNALHSVFEQAKSDYDSIPNSPIAEGLRERVIRQASVEAIETQAFYVEKALAIKMSPPPDMTHLLGGGSSQPHNGNGSSDGRNKAKPMDHSSGPKSSGDDKAGSTDKNEGKNQGEAHEKKKVGDLKSSGDDKADTDGKDGKKLADESEHTAKLKSSGADIAPTQPGNGQSPVGASQLGSAMSGMTSPASGMGGGGAGSPTSALQGLQSLGKGINPGQGLSGLGQTGSGATRPMSSSPLTSLSEGFSSGLSSASGGAGSVGPATPAGAVQQPSQFVPPVVRPEAAVPPAAISGPVNAAGLNAPAPSPTPAGSGGAMGGGGGMMGPYSSPTSGVGGGGGGGGAAPTGAASSGGAPPPAGGSSSTTMAPLPPPEERAAPVRAGRNPDLVLAEKLVADLVRGAPMALAEWAVSVVRTSSGPQVYVASSVAGGSFIPQGVHLPASARLAIADTALTPGWWAPYIGWTRPVDILVEHFSKLTEVVSGASLSAVATTSMTSRLPAHLRADFSLVDRGSISGAAPILGGGTQHRLATIDPAMYARLRGLRPEVAMVAAVGITNTVLQEAQKVQGVNGALSTDAETAMLQQVAQRGATEQDWVSYKAAARSADTELTTHATHSYDDEPETQRERDAYQLVFRRARIVELVCCWEEPLTPSLPDIVYNAICAGYQPAQIIDQAEQQQLGGR